MKIKIGIMGSAADVPGSENETLRSMAADLGRSTAAHDDVALLTGGTTGLVYIAGKAALDSGTTHVGISPAANEREHVEKYGLPLDACSVLIFTGFGLKGRNVVLVRSCDIVLFINGAMGSLNEFTIAHDEGKVIGCLSGTGGVADESEYLVHRFSKQTGARVLQHNDPVILVEMCLQEFGGC
ncbi:MAG TPA: hypothetical protein VMM84_17075 [Pyrinomonadaceae bacterium]|nr:hypothetical protein [Pyrinomonadaceae bacterium]